ncbi:hypothetical protein ACIA59_28830 [Micromonospora haikouensis]|uniref:hypothetical protein n=1 Tax=Micromonospora haikouensis TaxID=686309 RepID=UPI00378ECF06
MSNMKVPHGVQLPGTLTDEAAQEVVRYLAQRYGWAYLICSRTEVEDHLPDNDSRLMSPVRRLTDPEWQRVHRTPAWRRLPAVARRAISAAGTIGDALRQAALECDGCGITLDGPPSATWGLCPLCLTRADLDELRRKPCAGQLDGTSPHQWDNGACTTCKMPAAPPPPAVRLTPTTNAA